MAGYVPVERIGQQKDKLKQAYERSMCLRPYQIKEVQRFIQSKPKNSSIVELGAGGGHLSAWMLKQGFRSVSCMDIDDYLTHPELKSRFRACDLSRDRLPFKEKSIDGIIAIEVVEHLENMVWCLKEISRVLKPGGWFLMAIPNAANARRRIAFFLTGDNLLVGEKNDHLQNITHAVVKKLARAYFGDTACALLRYPVVFPFLRFQIPYVDLLADNRIYIIKKG